MKAVNWERKPLGAVADLCLGKMLDQNKNRGEPLPYLANVNVRWGEFELSDLRNMRFEPKEMDRYGLKFGDIVMCEGGEPGRCAIWKDQIPGMMIQKAIHRIRPKECLDYRFLFYSFLHLGNSRIFDQYFTGATIKHLPGEKLAKVEVGIPPLPVQQRIAGILSAYDELIENSQRRIKILESMARALYREWFVHFRFPGHEKHPRVASPLGEIPQGWEVKRLGELTKLITKGTTPTTLGREFQQDGINFVKAESIEPAGILIESKFAKIDADTHELLQRSQLCSGDILFSIAGVIGRVCSVPSRILPANTNQALAIVRCASALHVPFLYMTLRDDNFKNHCLGHVVQTAQANVSLSVLKAVPIVCPPRELLTEFNAHAESLLRQIQVLSEKIQNLRRTRDLLLPRLLSGQIDVGAITP